MHGLAALYQMDLAGTERKSVMGVPGGFGASNWVIHRGYIYVFCRKDGVEDGQSYREFTLKRYPLGQADKESLIFEKRYEGITVCNWKIQGNSLCLILDNDIESKGKRRDREIYLYNIQDELIENIANMSSKWQLLEFQMDSEGICFLEKAWEEQRVSRYDFEQGSVTQICHLKDGDGYVGILGYKEESVLFYTTFDRQASYRLWNMEGEELISDNLPRENWLLLACGADENGYWMIREVPIEETKVYLEGGAVTAEAYDELWVISENEAKVLCTGYRD